MRKKLDYVSTILLLLLGSAHTILTPVFYKTFDLNALWFAGTGLAFVFLGFLNISRMKTTDNTIKILCLVGNGLAFVYCIFIVLKLGEPQAFISFSICFFYWSSPLLIGRYQNEHKQAKGEHP